MSLTKKFRKLEQRFSEGDIPKGFHLGTFQGRNPDRAFMVKRQEKILALNFQRIKEDSLEKCFGHVDAGIEAINHEGDYGDLHGTIDWATFLED